MHEDNGPYGLKYLIRADTVVWYADLHSSNASGVSSNSEDPTCHIHESLSALDPGWFCLMIAVLDAKSLGESFLNVASATASRLRCSRHARFHV